MIRNRRVQTIERKRVLFLILATIPGAIGGLLLEEKAETVFRAPVLTACALIVMGLVLWASDRFSAMDRPLTSMRWLDALLSGNFAGVRIASRSVTLGSTISTGRLLKFDRQAAAVFSFLMSMPITAAQWCESSGCNSDDWLYDAAHRWSPCRGISSWLAIANSASLREAVTAMASSRSIASSSE
jgi:undecaprenyl pyrophosphate phosphatase UppP